MSNKFIQLTANNNTATHILLNADHIISIAPDGFSGTTNIMVAGCMFNVTENYDEVLQKLNPN